MTNAAIQQSEIDLAVARSQADSGMKRPSFSVGVQFNRQFGFLEIFSFSSEGIGAVLYILGATMGLPQVAAVGGFAVLLAVAALLSHLGTPQRSWRAMTNGSRSMTSRGTLAIGGFLCASALWLSLELMKSTGPLGGPFLGVSLLLAMAVVFYAGLLLRSVRAIGLWRGPVLPFAFGSHSLASGFAVFMVLVNHGSAGVDETKWLGAAILSLAACAAISLIHLGTVKRTRSVRASLDRALLGDLRAWFYGGACLLGIIVPLAIFSMLYVDGPQGASGVHWPLLAAAALSRLTGDYAYRRVIVKAGAYESIIG